MFAYKSIEYTPANKKQTSVCSFYFIKSLNGISQTWNSGIMKIKRKKESNSIDLAYIADVSVLTNPVINANIVFKVRHISSF